MALPRANRLPLRFERDRVSREGKTIFTKYLTVVIASQKSVIPSEVEESQTIKPRIGILLSKKTAKLAVNRNLIKRKLSAALIPLLARLAQSDYLLIPKATVLTASPSDLEADLQKIL